MYGFFSYQIGNEQSNLIAVSDNFDMLVEYAEKHIKDTNIHWDKNPIDGARIRNWENGYGDELYISWMLSDRVYTR